MCNSFADERNSVLPLVEGLYPSFQGHGRSLDACKVFKPEDSVPNVELIATSVSLNDRYERTFK